jgi:hypothetical protein
VTGGKPAGATANEEWAVVETTPGMYRLERSAERGPGRAPGQQSRRPPVRGAAPEPGPARLAGDFSAQVSFADARIDGGLNQIELQATFADGAIFYVVRDRERGGSHIWGPNLQGDAPCGKAGVLRMERRGETVTGYCDGRAIWSAPRKAALTRLQFVLQNNATNDPISASFRDWRFSAAAGAATSTPAATSTSANAGGLAGAWAINANGYTGKLELSEAGGRLSGRVWFDAHRVWEDLRDFSFDGRTLRFLRPGPNQRYTGTYSGDQVRGSFDGGGTWNWSMTRAGAAVAPAGSPRVAEFAWHGMDEDRVGDWGNGKPNGTRGRPLPAHPGGPGQVRRWPACRSGAPTRRAKRRAARSGTRATATTGCWACSATAASSTPATWPAWASSPDGSAWTSTPTVPAGSTRGNGSCWKWKAPTARWRARPCAWAPRPNPTAGRVNLARGKPASQSSTSEWSRAHDAQGAVDGVINGGFAFHTANQANPWWQVDLGGTYRLSEVRLYNRLDCCGERARTVQVMLSGDGRAWRTVYRHDGSLFGGQDGKPLVVSLNGETARHVRLRLNEANWFHLDEVEVMGGDEASNPAIDGGRDTTYQDGGRDYTYRDQAIQTPAAASPTASPTPADAQSLEEAGQQLMDAVKDLKNLFKW